MTTIRFGAKCDGEGCSTYYNNYDCGDIVHCDDCELDLCLPCRLETGHRIIREICCDECPGLLAGCA